MRSFYLDLSIVYVLHIVLEVNLLLYNLHLLIAYMRIKNRGFMTKESEKLIMLH